MAPRERPRDADVDERVLQATTELLAGHGYGGLSTDEVAERAGIAKATLYRRRPAKDHLALAVIARLRSHDEITDTGDIRRDLTDYMERIAAGLNRMRVAGRPPGQESRSAGTVAELVAAMTLLEQLAGALCYRVLITGNPVDRACAERLVNAALDGAL
ncbi:helix-turn-helix domain-containing protein [Nonomuraea sp. NPDC049695]|uniref:TetR/AcrR family transcriptional regulator n=1 Tax=Nonomuraea sp. NPDC049695 TaxID=3154734 RepID=UPI003425CDDD